MTGRPTLRRRVIEIHEQQTFGARGVPAVLYSEVMTVISAGSSA